MKNSGRAAGIHQVGCTDFSVAAATSARKWDMVRNPVLVAPTPVNVPLHEHRDDDPFQLVIYRRHRTECVIQTGTSTPLVMTMHLVHTTESSLLYVEVINRTSFTMSTTVPTAGHFVTTMIIIQRNNETCSSRIDDSNRFDLKQLTATIAVVEVTAVHYQLHVNHVELCRRLTNVFVQPHMVLSSTFRSFTIWISDRMASPSGRFPGESTRWSLIFIHRPVTITSKRPTNRQEIHS